MRESERLQHLSIIRDGLDPHTARPSRVIVVGAGMAGLVAAYELLRAGHDPVILEARSRAGGRVRTVREPFAHGLYAEAGAMRIPRSHQLTMAYVEKWRLATSPFKMHNPCALYYVHGQRIRIEEADPNRLGYDVSEREHGKTPAQLWEETIHPLVQRLQAEGDAGWEQITALYDGHSIRRFLETHGWSQGAIEMFGVLYDQESQMDASFLEFLREEVGSYYADMVEIDDGMDQLPRAFLPALHDRIRFGARMTAIDQDSSSVTVHYQTLARQVQVRGEYAIITIPFPALRRVETLTPFSSGKQRAIRQLHYDSATKVFLQCRRRFWEESDGIFGGVSITDLALDTLYYPEHGRDTGRGVLLASYTWGNHARQWGSLRPADRILQAVENVAHMHPEVKEAFEVGDSMVWDQDEFAGGAFALFTPGQETLLYEHIVAPEGRIHFAGEHTTRTHAWIQGAIESGLRAAREVHHARTR